MCKILKTKPAYAHLGIQYIHNKLQTHGQGGCTWPTSGDDSGKEGKNGEETKEA